MSLFTIFLEAGLAVLMTVLIVYCVILNRRLAAIRSQDAEIKEMTASFEAASQRAEASVARLKSAGLAAESSLRAVIAEAEIAGATISVATMSPALAVDRKMSSVPSGVDQEPIPNGDFESSQLNSDAPDSHISDQPLPQTEDRKKAELTVLEAIRLARTKA